MPKHQIKVIQGNPISPEIRDLLSRYFNSKELERLERLGGRILITISAPYRDTGGQCSKVQIDLGFVERLISERNETDKVQQVLEALSVGQLKQLCSLLGQPVRSSANRAEIMTEIARTLRDQDLWTRISSSARKEH